jgi:hypothetical protein
MPPAVAIRANPQQSRCRIARFLLIETWPAPTAGLDTVWEGHPVIVTREDIKKPYHKAEVILELIFRYVRRVAGVSRPGGTNGQPDLVAPCLPHGVIAAWPIIIMLHFVSRPLADDR